MLRFHVFWERSLVSQSAARRAAVLVEGAWTSGRSSLQGASLWTRVATDIHYNLPRIFTRVTRWPLRNVDLDWHLHPRFPCQKSRKNCQTAASVDVCRIRFVCSKPGPVRNIARTEKRENVSRINILALQKYDSAKFHFGPLADEHPKIWFFKR